MINKCIVCGKDFEAIKSTKKYCSNDCLNTMRRKKHAEAKTNSKANKEKICPICGNSFIPKTPSANQRICCYNCMPDGI